ncbi:MAG: energy-coupling factor ABC transporter ATP-binding protein [Propionibacteriaceae bacterium]|jgi:biotin transport system ATP-binding protein|nr:energy-coupling factor ABC transporter ATP-binding protein [Propionibacteriaceae bacterium]
MIEFVDVAVRVRLPQAGQTAVKTLLEDVNLQLSEHRIAVIGANGSGKSTLLRLINGLIEPDQGKVLVDGLDTLREGKQVRGQVGFIFTDALSQLLLSTPLDDVELSLRARVKDRTERREAARALLAERGLAEVAEQSVYDLSGGERQLVALTSILSLQPQVVVADEPTTLLDLKNKYLVRKAFNALEQQLIYATHDLDWAEKADRVIVVHRGRVVASGLPEQCIRHYLELMDS